MNFLGKNRTLPAIKDVSAFHDELHPGGWRRLFAVRMLLVVVIMLQLPSIAVALRVSDFTFSHLGLVDGLNSQRIYSLKQTDDGAIWLTTQSFVARYNGVSIKNFDLAWYTGKYSWIGGEPRFVQSVDNSVLQVFDSGGRIYEYNPVQNHFKVIADVTGFFKQDYQLNDVYRDGDTYWLAMSEGVYMLRNGKIVAVGSKVYTNCIIRGSKGILLFGTRQGVKTLSKSHKNANHKTLVPYLPYVVVSGYYDTDTKRLWLGTYDKGLIVADGNGVCISMDGIPHFSVRSIVVYDNTTMLVGVDGFGVYQVSRLPSAKAKASLLFNANDGEHGVLHGNGIYALLVDAWNDILIGSYSGGIDIARPLGNAITIYRYQRNKATLVNDHVNCAAQLSPSTLAMGTDGGISVLNTVTGEWRNIARNMVVLSLRSKPNGGGLLAATYGNGVYEISTNGEVRELYGTAVLEDAHVHDLLFDRNGHLWIGCQDAQLIEVVQGKFRYYPVNNVKSLALLPDGRIAAGTINGIYIVTPGQKKVKELQYFSSSANSVNRYVLNLFIHDERYLDIATYGGGLYVYDLRTGKCRQFTMNNGLPSNIVTSITQDNLGRLWFATDGGLSFADPDNLDKIISVNYHYGLQREYSQGAAFNLHNGNLIFGSVEGVVVINPHYVQKHNYTAKLRFTGISCNDDNSEQFNEKVAKMLGKRKLKLSYQQRTFELYIESINLRYQFDIAYQYKVESGNWSPLSTLQYIRFVNLEPGTHHLTVRAVSKANRIVLDEQKLVITIGRPWWSSWWMWCVYISLIVLLFYGALWTYGLHIRYMRLVVSTLGSGSGKDLTASQSEQKQDNAKQHISVNNVLPLDDSKEDDAATVTKENTAFVDTVTKILLSHISDSDFTIDRLCKEMAMSRTMFYVKLKSYTGKSPQEFIRIVRLERAAVLLRSGHHVGNVAEEVGFDNAKYFSTAFKKYFGVSPSKYK